MKRVSIILAITFIAMQLGFTLRPTQAASTSSYERMLTATVGIPNGVALRTTWDETGSILGQLPADNRVLIDGRNADNTWLHVHSQFGHGYAPVAAFNVVGNLNKVPIVEGNLPNTPLPPEVATDDAKKYPVLPQFSDYTKQIFQRGIKVGNRAAVFSKVGDCMSSDVNLFLGRFASSNYDLGYYKFLQNVIDYYKTVSPQPGVPNSFATRSVASYNGFTSVSVEDSTWNTSTTCNPSSSPLSCEYDLSKPSVSIIMFGTNDINSLTPMQYDFYMRLVVFDTIDRGIIPLLNTFPGSPRSEKRSNQFNQIVYQIGQDYDVPVVNLWLALQSLPGQGRDADSPYLSLTPFTHVSHFTPENLTAGYTIRNLVTLEALDALWREVIKTQS